MDQPQRFDHSEDVSLLEWAILVLAVLMGIGGLFLADSGATGWGWALFGIAVIIGFWGINRHFDRIERIRRRSLTEADRR